MNLKEDVVDIRAVDNDQWTAINNLRKLVYTGAGIVTAGAFFGSIIGNLLIGLFKK